MSEAARWEERVVIRLTDNCFIRAAPSAAGAVLGVAKRGEALPYGGRTSPEGWRLVLYRGSPGWVTGRNSDLSQGDKSEFQWPVVSCQWSEGLSHADF